LTDCQPSTNFGYQFTKEYPTKAPTVNGITTNHGRTRFNPNIYATGRVCLSILGTWRGEPGEEWSSAQGLESILISIQSLMSANPYENEPGFENATQEEDKKMQKLYAAKIRHETLRISVIERLEHYMGINYRSGAPALKPVIVKEETDADEYSFEPFKDKCKLRFLWYYDSYLQSIDRESREHKDKESFTNMPFEGVGNEMVGYFNYTELRQRLTIIKQELDKETDSWVRQGKEAVEKERSIAVNLRRQFETASENISDFAGGNLDLGLVDKNPFLWEILLFGRGENLERGVFKIHMYISPNFPMELPRVRVVTPMFHHRVSPSGQLCYLIGYKDIENLTKHVEAIITAIEDEHPAYDPRTIVNPEASKLYWGSPEDRKQYDKKLQKSAENSHEYI